MFVDNIRQEPTTAYSVSGTTLTFTEAPPTGTNNVYVIHQHQALGTGPLPPQDLGSTDYIFGDDISFNSDGAVINFGLDSEVNLTHVHNTGLQLNSTNKIMFGDSASFIQQSSDGVLTLEGETTVDINGAVDISGNTTLGGTLDMNGAELILDADADTSLTADTDDQIDIRIGGVDVGKITGTSSELRIGGAVADKDLTFRVNDGGSEITAGVFNAANAGAFQVRDGSASAPSLSFTDDPDTGLYTPNANTIDVTLEGTERVRFQEDHGGETIFGVNVATGGGGKVTIEQNTSGRSTINAKHDRDGTDTNGYPYGIISQFANNSSTSFHLFEGYGGGAIKFRVNSNGNVINVNNSYGSISDVNLKENIEDASSQWDDIKAVKVRKFSWKSDKKDKADMLGVIAQELETSGMGGLVQESPDTRPTEDGGFEQTGTSHKSVKYSILYMKAIKALQETMTKVEKLETVAKSKGWDLS